MAKRHPSVVCHSSGALMLIDTSTTQRVTKVTKLIRMCGAYATALYLKNREYTLDEALQLMFPSMTPEHRNRFNQIAPLN